MAKRSDLNLNAHILFFLEEDAWHPLPTRVSFAARSRWIQLRMIFNPPETYLTEAWQRFYLQRLAPGVCDRYEVALRSISLEIASLAQALDRSKLRQAHHRSLYCGSTAVTVTL